MYTFESIISRMTPSYTDYILYIHTVCSTCIFKHFTSHCYYSCYWRCCCCCLFLRRHCTDCQFFITRQPVGCCWYIHSTYTTLSLIVCSKPAPKVRIRQWAGNNNKKRHYNEIYQTRLDAMECQGRLFNRPSTLPLSSQGITLSSPKSKVCLDVEWNRKL